MANNQAGNGKEENNMNTKKTIGEAAYEMAFECFEMYKRIRLEKPDYAKTQKQAENLAFHDILIMELKAEFAKEHLKRFISAYEDGEVQP